MNEKLSLQNLAESLSLKAGVSKKVAESFSKAFFDTIVDALYMGEEVIKVKGLGTFKLIEVESRESVNVTNGERIVIPGYKKISFTPDDTVVEQLNKKEEKQENKVISEEEIVETPVPAIQEDNKNVDTSVSAISYDDDNAESSVPAISEEEENVEAVTPIVPQAENVQEEVEPIEDLVSVPEPDAVETPADELSGIDMLISTPESLEEVRAQFEDAKAKAEAAIEEARKANAEKVRLEKLLSRLEANSVPESMGSESQQEEREGDSEVVTNIAENSIDTDNQSESPEVDDSHSTEEGSTANNAVAVLPGEKKEESIEETKASDESSEEKAPKKKSSTGWIIALLIALLLGTVVFFMYKTSKSIDEVEKVDAVEQASKQPKIEEPKPAPKVEQKDSVSNAANSKENAAKADSVKTDPASKDKKTEQKKEEAPAVPKTHTIRKGESLTRISQKYYGTKDSVNAIIRLNRFSDPNNVPVGARIMLP
ncbi:MAG: HU family DNA-binding protein [Prevotellaceae bacterium]|nr:HU family DNA-binding protein [Candidatus Minthosoma caballi]